jgi:hypothetical protein
MNTKSKKTIVVSVALVASIAISQGLFWQSTTKQIKDVVQQFVSESEKTYKNYNELMSVSRKTDQKQIVDKFNQLQSFKSAISDLLVSQYILSIVDNISVSPEADEEFKKNHPQETEDARMKLDDQTQKIILRTYLLNPKEGVAQSRELFNKFSCSFFNIPCHILKPDFEKENNKMVNLVESKIDANFYNITHIKEYAEWKMKYFQSLAQEQRQYIPSPGQIEAEKKFKKK